MCNYLTSTDEYKAHTSHIKYLQISHNIFFITSTWIQGNSMKNGVQYISEKKMTAKKKQNMLTSMAFTTYYILLS